MERKTMLKMAAPLALVLLAAVPKTFGDDHDKKTDVTFSQPVQVPGGVVLQPGKYTLILLNSSSNRHIVEIRSEDAKKLYAMAMTAAAQRLERTDKVALTFYEMPQGDPQAIREWFWPGDFEGQEFLYPHKQATEISQAVHKTVPEASEDELASLQAKSSAASVEASDANIKTDVSASAAVAAAEPASQAPETTQTQAEVAPPPPAPAQADKDQLVAQAKPPADNFRSDDANSNNAVIAQAAPAPAPVPTPDPQNSNDNAALPQTASDLPLISLVGLVSIAAAVTVRMAARGRA